MKKLYEVITAMYNEKIKVYSPRVRREKVLAQTAEDAISKVKPTLLNENDEFEFIDEVILISTVDIE